MDILSTLNLNNNEIKGFIVDNVTSLGTGQPEGRFVYNGGSLHYWGDGGTVYTLLTNKNGSIKNANLEKAYVTIAGQNVSLGGSISANTIVGEATSAATFAGTAAKATILATARNIWGQSFNGSADISGNMSSVGKITFTTQSSKATSGNVLEVVTIDGVPYLHTTLPFFSDSSVSSGGVGSGGSGGGDVSSIVIDGVTQDNDDGVVTLDLSAYAKKTTDIAPLAARVTALESTTPHVSFGTEGSDYVPLTVNGVTKYLLTEHQSLAGYATESWVLGKDYADKTFVNSSIATATATFRGTSAVGLTLAQFLAWANGLEHDNNDYVFWNTTDSTGNVQFKRYKYNGTSWVYEYTLNNSSFTQSQWAAINSGITSTLVTAFGNKYDKPSGGIPKTDLASAVQTSLGLADSALQSHQTITLASGTNNGTLKITTAAGTVDNIAVKGLGSLAYKSSLVASDIPSLDASKITSGTFADARIASASKWNEATSAKTYNTTSGQAAYTSGYDFANNNIVAALYDGSGNVVVTDMQVVALNGKYGVKVTFAQAPSVSYKLVVIGKLA